MAPRSLLRAALPLLLALLSTALVAEAVPRLDAFVGADLDSKQRSSSRSSSSSLPDTASETAVTARESKTPLDDLTAFWLENADELAARDARMSPEDLAVELSRRETEWRNAARRKEQAERTENGGDEDKGFKSLREMERERKRFKEEKGRDSSTEEGTLDPSSNVIDAATLYSPPKATAFRAQGDAPAKISLGKMLTEGTWRAVAFFFFRGPSIGGGRNQKKKKKKTHSISSLSPPPPLSLSFSRCLYSRLRPQGRRPRHCPGSGPRRGGPPAHGPQHLRPHGGRGRGGPAQVPCLKPAAGAAAERLRRAAQRRPRRCADPARPVRGRPPEDAHRGVEARAQRLQRRRLGLCRGVVGRPAAPRVPPARPGPLLGQRHRDRGQQPGL